MLQKNVVKLYVCTVIYSDLLCTNLPCTLIFIYIFFMKESQLIFCILTLKRPLIEFHTTYNYLNLNVYCLGINGKVLNIIKDFLSG